MVDGRRHTFVLQATTLEGAVAEALMLRANPNIYELGAWAQEVEAYLADAVRRRKISVDTANTRRGSLMRLKEKLGVESPRSVTPLMMERWLEEVVAEHPGNSTASTYQTHAKAFFRFLKKAGKVHLDPTEALLSPPHQKVLREVFLPAEEVRALLTAARAKGDRDLEFILAMGFECGMRRSEIASAKPEWFDLKVGVVTVPVLDDRFKRKGREGRRKSATIPLSTPFLEIIARHGLPSPFVVMPEKLWGDWIYRFDFRKRLKNFFLSHGHEELTIHDMRRSFASNRVSAGVSIEKVANWLGIDVKTAWERYSRFIPADEEINRGAAVKAEEKEVAPAGAAERLKGLKELRESELITEVEYAAKRDEIIAGI